MSKQGKNLSRKWNKQIIISVNCLIILKKNKSKP